MKRKGRFPVAFFLFGASLATIYAGEILESPIGVALGFGGYVVGWYWRSLRDRDILGNSRCDYINAVLEGWPETCLDPHIGWRAPFYAFKTLICLLLGLRRGRHGYTDLVELATLNVSRAEAPDAHSRAKVWDEISVGRGLLRGWFYRVYPNGSY